MLVREELRASTTLCTSSERYSFRALGEGEVGGGRNGGEGGTGSSVGEGGRR